MHSDTVSIHEVRTTDDLLLLLLFFGVKCNHSIAFHCICIFGNSFSLTNCFLMLPADQLRALIRYVSVLGKRTIERAVSQSADIQATLDGDVMKDGPDMRDRNGGRLMLV